MTHPTSRASAPRRLALLVALAALAPMLFALVPAAPAAAVDDGTLGIRPELEADFFHITLDAGSSIDATAIVTNHTNADVTLLTYAVDGMSTPQGAFALADQDDTQVGSGAWVSVDSASITVPAESDARVPFTLSVPVGTRPGDYPGGLIIQSPTIEGETTTNEGDAALRLDVIQRQGVRIYLTVAGTAVETLEHGDLSYDRADGALTFTLPITNTGNSILNPTAELDLSSVIGATETVTFTAPESILPGATLDLTAQITPAPFLQLGTATATLTSAAGTDTASTGVNYAPWWFVAGLLLVLAAVGFAIWRIALFVKKARAALAQISQAATPATPATPSTPSTPSTTTDAATMPTATTPPGELPLRRPRT
ncbi:DUF916 domain-containing protein [Cryobacterium frigoriphilum]|uniref:DUF916 domain-containing protein n=1 Tax=Cryobacterium frigoriphilum TaxID=1259150 RepID=UPI001580A83A|nr:DUF916 domain-containing protein [Cryobacterium frigoriphilum]